MGNRLLAAAAPARARDAAAATHVTVFAGKPSEFRFTLSKRTIPHGTVVFTISNKGTLLHDFKVCSAPTRTAKANSCAGKDSKHISPGQSTKLTVVFKKPGNYEYLCTIAGHAAAGMKGILRVSATAAPTWELVLAHEHTKKAATIVLKEVEKLAHTQALPTVIEHDGRDGYEVAIVGFHTQKQANAARTQAKAGFAHASLEPR